MDQLLDETTQLRERLKLTTEKYEATKAEIEIQSQHLKTLKETIDKQQTDVNSKLKIVDEARKVNLFEEEKNRKYSKANAALKAKLDFIESKYDYTTSAKEMSVEDFKALISSNSNVNSTMTGFTTKLESIQKEI